MDKNKCPKSKFRKTFGKKKLIKIINFQNNLKKFIIYLSKQQVLKIIDVT